MFSRGEGDHGPSVRSQIVENGSSTIVTIFRTKLSTGYSVKS